MSLTVYFLKRYLLLNNKFDFVSLTLVISILAISTTVASMTIIFSTLSGFKLDFESKIIKLNPHITLSKYSGGFVRGEYIKNLIDSVKYVHSYDDFLKKQAFIKINKSIFGVIVVNFNEKTRANIGLSIAQPPKKNGKYQTVPNIILDSNLVKKFFLNSHENLEIIFHNGCVTPFGCISILKKFKKGNYDFFVSKLSVGYVEQNVIESVFNIRNLLTTIEVRVKDYNEIEKVKCRFFKTINCGFSIKSWSELNTSLCRVIRFGKIAMFFVFFLVIVLSSFGIVCFLTISIFYRKYEISMLKFLGMANGYIKMTFILKITIFNLLGILLGLAIGILMSLVLRNVAIIDIPIDFCYTNKLLIELKFLNIFFVAIISLFASVLSNTLSIKIILSDKFYRDV